MAPNIAVSSWILFLLWYRRLLDTTFEIQTTSKQFTLIPTCFIILYKTIRAWNNLSDETKEAISIAEFKFRLNRNISKPPNYYNTGSRKGQTLHSRMRMECSSLNSNLFRKNIVADPSCQCGVFGVFFFNCPRYAAARTRYLPNNINAYTSHDFLFGIDNKTQGENEALFSQVQEFIVNSGRFTWGNRD